LPVVYRQRRYIGDRRIGGTKRLFHILSAAPYSEKPDNGYLFADFASGRLVIVLRDWSRLELDRDGLIEVGFQVSEIESRLVTAATVAGRDERGVIRRWLVSDEEDEGKLVISTKPTDDRADELEHLVGRVQAGEAKWFEDPADNLHDPVQGAIEVLLLPRIESGPKANDERLPPTWNGDFVVGPEWPRALEGSDDEPDFGQTASGRMLRQTVMAQDEEAGRLMAMLELANDVDIHEDERQITAHPDQDPSAIAWLPVVHALESAAEAQRRRYVRHSDQRRAPTGTVKFGKYARNKATGRADRVPVERFDLTFNSPENRLLRGMAELLARGLRDCVGALGDRLADRLECVTGQFCRTQGVVPTISQFAALPEDPNRPEAVKVALDRCREVLEREYPGLSIDGQEVVEMDGFQLSISSLFEEAVRCAVSNALGTTVSSPSDEHFEPRGHALSWKPGGASQSTNNSPKLKPDLLVETPSITVVGDVKYKKVAPPQYSSYAPLRRNDFHQIQSYMLSWPAAKGVVVLPEESETEGETATRLLRTLCIEGAGSGSRELRIFSFSPERWDETDLAEEPLVKWCMSESR
jgi:hypothetical protein